MFMMLRTARPGLEVRDTRVPAHRRTGLGLPVRHRNQFMLVVSWLVRRVRFRVLPGICSQELRLRVAGTAGDRGQGAAGAGTCGLWCGQAVSPAPSSEAYSSSHPPLLTFLVLFCPWRSVAAAIQPGRRYLSVGTSWGSLDCSLPWATGGTFLSLSTCLWGPLPCLSPPVPSSGPVIPCDGWYFLPPGVVPLGWDSWAETQGSEREKKKKAKQRGFL